MGWENGTALLCDYVMATVFAASAFGKSRAMTDLRMEIHDHRLLPERLVPAAAGTTLVCEIALAAAFGAGGFLQGVKEPIAIAALLAMSWMTWRRRRASGQSAVCACFGANHPLGRRPLTRNAALAAIAAASWTLGRPADSTADMLAFALAVAAAVWLLEVYKLRSETGAGGRRRPDVYR